MQGITGEKMLNFINYTIFSGILFIVCYIKLFNSINYVNGFDISAAKKELSSLNKLSPVSKYYNNTIIIF